MTCMYICTLTVHTYVYPPHTLSHIRKQMCKARITIETIEVTFYKAIKHTFVYRNVCEGALSINSKLSMYFIVYVRVFPSPSLLPSPTLPSSLLSPPSLSFPYTSPSLPQVKESLSFPYTSPSFSLLLLHLSLSLSPSPTPLPLSPPLSPSPTPFPLSLLPLHPSLSLLTSLSVHVYTHKHTLTYKFSSSRTGINPRSRKDILTVTKS